MFLGRIVPAFIYVYVCVCVCVYSKTIDFLLVHLKKYN